MTTTGRRSTTTKASAAKPEAQDLAATQLAQALGRLLRMLRRAHSGPLPAGSLSALATVVRQGPVRLGDLAEREGVQPPTLSRVVGALERDGYVERVVDPADRRSAFLVATARGSATFEEVWGLRAAALVERMRRLSDEDQRLVAAAIPALARLADDD